MLLVVVQSVPHEIHLHMFLWRVPSGAGGCLRMFIDRLPDRQEAERGHGGGGDKSGHLQHQLFIDFLGQLHGRDEMKGPVLRAVGHRRGMQRENFQVRLRARDAALALGFGQRIHGMSSQQKGRT